MLNAWDNFSKQELPALDSESLIQHLLDAEQEWHHTADDRDTFDSNPAGIAARWLRVELVDRLAEAPATHEQLRLALNREATMRETLARAQGECTRLTEELREARKERVEPPVMLGFIRSSAMFTEAEKAITDRAVATWGPWKQLSKLAEECLELSLACRRVEQGRDGAWLQFADEVADVEIMLAQVSAIARGMSRNEFDIAVMMQRHAKLERLKERLEG